MNGKETMRGKGVRPCAECRRLKRQCEQVFPCKHCAKRGLAGICPNGELANGSRRVKILASTEDLHDRIADLEEALKRVTSPDHPLLEKALYVNNVQVHHHENGGSSSISPPNSDAVDNPSSYGHLTLSDDPKVSRYYGAASSVYLSKRPNTTSLRSQDVDDLDFSEFLSPFPTRDAPLEVTEIMARHLPSAHTGRELAALYFQTCGWFMDIVQESSWDSAFFNHVYDDHGTPPDSQRLAVVLLVFALGALMDLSQPPHCELSKQLLFAARICLALDRSHSVMYIQCLVLYATFLMNGDRDTSGGDTVWPLLRLGMGVAEAMGLHRDGSAWGLALDEVNERRRIFWEIQGYDVLQSIGLGRGQCIADYAIDCAYPEPDLDHMFHIKTYELTRIWSRINDRQIRIRPSTYSEVTEIERALRNFQLDLPEYLSPGVAPSPMDLTNPSRQKMALQRNMILLFINEARLVLHRGWFVRVLKEYALEPLHSPQKQSYLDCLEASRRIVGLVRNMLALHGLLIHRRWHFFFHLFSSCVCLAAAAIRAPRSSLSRAILSELDAGVELFRITKREELNTIDKLWNHAFRAVNASSTSSSSSGETDTEDLDLLGARKTCRRSRHGADLTTVDDFAYPISDIRQVETANNLLDFDMDAFLAEIGAAAL
ncbi:hypothetical protein BCR39DRAFT_535986 [Naematelia encephala]|uniref:Zn(2)-C6 fungal-type domain-containing protein n=1 Tax=Naematelia encephala TaxID=71784 RepID=A0A1Y2B043_9TREE|nr:hypothetical protein BCR39DRAFT_535986 [Naematelia encephala]